MNSGTLKSGPPSRTGPGGYPAAAPNNQAILRDKLNVRRSTPDSEALASSDDESDIHRQDNAPSSVQPPKPVRRSSWLNDMSQPTAPPKTGSFASSSCMSPTTSHPSTPAVESGVSGTWPSHSTSSTLNRGHPGSSSFPWGTGIWNSERKEPPSRFQEVLPSPTSSMPPAGSNAFFPNENGLGQPLPLHKDASNPPIPFAIPLHPTPKTYRSQSYSVGQLEPDVSGASLGQSVHGTRGRMLGHSGLHHRPSRPSMLSEMASDGTMLGKLTEDDDDEASNASVPGKQNPSAEAAKTIEMLSRENAMLRQQQYQNSRLRSRASTASSYNLGNGHLQEPVPEESEYAIDELDDGNDGNEQPKRHLGRRMSEYGAVPFRTPLLVENRKLENVKKGFWQTSLGFGVSGLADVPQSRRHSFADVSTRQGSISSISESAGVHEASAQEAAYPDYSTTYPDNSNYPVANHGYYNGNSGMHGLQSPVYSNPYGPGYTALNTYTHRPFSPPRNMYPLATPRQNQNLHIVLFKCARADVFYIQEGTGLTVKPGDLVIVEADRGTDLGTVAKDNVDWQTAKELKEHYAEEQYKWLMMYSQNAAAAQDGVGAGLLAGSSGLDTSAVGGMGPPGQHHMQESSSVELKPKLIKRLAQSHEIHALRDKEGNEAKAKRVCMQKVKEHGLNMEILDAEFQMDWKKLTFYYFADSYINFNSLVTDLFKIYKTRIWMSAINPASFASSTFGLQAPSGIGPGAIGVGRGVTVSQRRQDQQQDPPPNFGAAKQQARGAQPSHGPSFPADRTCITAAAFSASNYAFNPYRAFGNATRPGNSPFGPPGMGVPDTFPTSYAHAPVARFTAPPTSDGQLDPSGLSLGTQADWVTGSFQGLSLHSR